MSPLDPSMRSVTSFLLQITELGLLPWMRIIRFRFTQFSIKLPLLGLDPPYNVVCTGVTFCVKFLSSAPAAVDDIYYLLVGSLSTSVGRYAKETVSCSGSLPSNASNPQWHGTEVPCVGIGLLGMGCSPSHCIFMHSTGLFLSSCMVSCPGGLCHWFSFLLFYQFWLTTGSMVCGSNPWWGRDYLRLSGCPGVYPASGTMGTRILSWGKAARTCCWPPIPM
jgi:hypothetical protein